MKTVVNQADDDDDDDDVVEEETLTIPANDVKLVISVIDVVAKRGGFLPMTLRQLVNFTKSYLIT